MILQHAVVKNKILNKIQCLYKIAFTRGIGTVYSRISEYGYRAIFESHMYRVRGWNHRELRPISKGFIIL